MTDEFILKITNRNLEKHVMYWFRDRALEKLWGEWGIFELQEFFSLSNSLYEFFLGHSMNIF